MEKTRMYYSCIDTTVNVPRNRKGFFIVGLTDAELTEDLQDLAASWMSLGTQLNIRRARLRAIKGVDSGAVNCFEAIIEEWLLRVKPPHTKAKLMEILRRESLKENKLASNIEKDKGKGTHIHINFSKHLCIILYSDIPDDFDEDTDAAIPLLIIKLSTIAAQYSQFGLQLGVSNDKIKEIEKKVVNVRECLQNMLAEWNKESRPLQDVLKAIRSPSVGNLKLARDLEQKWTKDGHCESSIISAHFSLYLNLLIIAWFEINIMFITMSSLSPPHFTVPALVDTTDGSPPDIR